MIYHLITFHYIPKWFPNDQKLLNDQRLLNNQIHLNNQSRLAHIQLVRYTISFDIDIDDDFSSEAFCKVIDLFFERASSASYA